MLLCSLVPALAYASPAQPPPDKVILYYPSAREIQEKGATFPVKISLGYAKALLVAWNDYSAIPTIEPSQKHIEYFPIFVSRAKDNYIVYLLPLQVMHTRFITLGGGTVYGLEYRYLIRQKDYKIIKRQDYK